MKLIKSVTLCAKLSIIKSTMPIALSDPRVWIVMQAAGPLAIEKRTVFLELIGAKLRMRGLRRPTDLDIAHGAARAGARAAAGPAPNITVGGLRLGASK